MFKIPYKNKSLGAVYRCRDIKLLILWFWSSCLLPLSLAVCYLSFTTEWERLKRRNREGLQAIRRRLHWQNLFQKSQASGQRARGEPHGWGVTGASVSRCGEIHRKRTFLWVKVTDELCLVNQWVVNDIRSDKIPHHGATADTVRKHCMFLTIVL